MQNYLRPLFRYKGIIVKKFFNVYKLVNIFTTLYHGPGIAFAKKANLYVWKPFLQDLAQWKRKNDIPYAISPAYNDVIQYYSV